MSTDHNAPKEDVKKKIDKAEGLIKEVTNDNQKKGKDSNESKLEEACVALKKRVLQADLNAVIQVNESKLERCQPGAC